MKKFSIILPVRNGGEYVKQCVNSILNQTLNAFNLIVLDNCSTDGTLKWIQSLTDERIIIYPSAIPLSIEENWARIITVPKNEFITLIGHDDILRPDYLKTINELVNKFPEATLYQTHFSFINDKGNIIRNCKLMQEKEDGQQFLQSILQNKIDIVGTGFMMRSKDYDELGGIPIYYPNLLFADFELWLHLTDKNCKATAAEEGFYFRLHQSTTTSSSNIKYQIAFEKFLDFLKHLQNKNAAYNTIISNYIDEFILFYCKSLSHRLLKIPKPRREGLTVKMLLEKCKKYKKIFSTDQNLKPLSHPSILAAYIIDSNAATRKLFLRFKSLYKQPFLK